MANGNFHESAPFCSCALRVQTLMVEQLYALAEGNLDRVHDCHRKVMGVLTYHPSLTHSYAIFAMELSEKLVDLGKRETCPPSLVTVQPKQGH